MALDLEIDELYVKFKNTLNEETKKTVGLRKRKLVDGVTQVEVDLCQLRREARKEMLKDPSAPGKRALYSELNREVKKAEKLAKDKSLEGKVLLLEAQYQMNNSLSLFKTVRELEGKPKKDLFLIKDENGEKYFSRKAPGADEISIEVIKAGGEEMIGML